MMTVQEYVQRIPSKITWSRSLEGAGRDCKNLERLIEGEVAEASGSGKMVSCRDSGASCRRGNRSELEAPLDSWRAGHADSGLRPRRLGCRGTLRKTRRTQVARAVPRIDANLALHKNLTQRVHDGRPQRQPPGVTRGNPRIPKIIRRFGFASGPPTVPTTHSD
jgi:hypothetical protein